MLKEINKNKLSKKNCKFFNYDPIPSNTNPISYFASVLPQFQGRTNLYLIADTSHEEFCFTAGAIKTAYKFPRGRSPPLPPRLVRHCAIQNFYIYGTGNLPRFPSFTFTDVYSRYYYRILSM